jgi:hypothetical protein
MFAHHPVHNVVSVLACERVAEFRGIGRKDAFHAEDAFDHSSHGGTNLALLFVRELLELSTVDLVAFHGFPWWYVDAVEGPVQQES